jgi:hypothetical protein
MIVEIMLESVAKCGSLNAVTCDGPRLKATLIMLLELVHHELDWASRMELFEAEIIDWVGDTVAKDGNTNKLLPIATDAWLAGVDCALLLDELA